MESETELMDLLRDYRGGGTISEERAIAALKKLAELQKIDDSFVIASSVDIPEIDPANIFEPTPSHAADGTKSEEGTARHGSTAEHRPIDLGIVIPLKEEFEVLHGYLDGKCRVTRSPSNRCHYYQFERPSNDGSSYNCVATFAGEMGNNKAGLVTQRLLLDWNPTSLAIIGIAAGISDDVRIGDVVAATLVDNYLENSKATHGEDQFNMQLSGEPYRPSYQILDEIRNFQFAHADEFNAWKTDCQTIATRLLTTQLEQLVQDATVRRDPRLVEAHIASGPTVGATDKFVDWLKKSRDRKYIALEMEGAGVLSAIYESASNCQSLMLRGVSDYADQRKSQTDRVRDGALRKYAVHSAIQLLWHMLAAGTLERKSAV